MINQRPNGAGRVFREQIIPWELLEYIPTRTAFHSMAKKTHGHMGIRGGGCATMCVHFMDGKNMLEAS